MPGGPTKLFKHLVDLCRETKGLESLDVAIAGAGHLGPVGRWKVGHSIPPLEVSVEPGAGQ